MPDGMPPKPPNRWTIEALVPGNRWVIRNGEQVLQQYMGIKTYQRVIDVESCIGYHGEWRDVPTETEY